MDVAYSLARGCIQGCVRSCPILRYLLKGSGAPAQPQPQTFLLSNTYFLRIITTQHRIWRLPNLALTEYMQHHDPRTKARLDLQLNLEAR
jgi:hypothetical protein